MGNFFDTFNKEKEQHKSKASISPVTTSAKSDFFANFEAEKRNSSYGVKRGMSDKQKNEERAITETIANEFTVEKLFNGEGLWNTHATKKETTPIPSEPSDPQNRNTTALTDVFKAKLNANLPIPSTAKKEAPENEYDKKFEQQLDNLVPADKSLNLNVQQPKNYEDILRNLGKTDVSEDAPVMPATPEQSSKVAYGDEFINESLAALGSLDLNDYNSTEEYIKKIKNAKSRSISDAELYNYEEVAQTVNKDGADFAGTAVDNVISQYNLRADHDKRLPFDLAGEYTNYVGNEQERESVNQFMSEMELSHFTSNSNSNTEYSSEILSAMLSVPATGIGKSARDKKLITKSQATDIAKKYARSVSPVYALFSLPESLDVYGFGDLEKNVSFMTDNERAIYFAILQREGVESADAFFSKLLPTLQRRNENTIVERSNVENDLGSQLLLTGLNVVKPLTDLGAVGTDVLDKAFNVLGSERFDNAARSNKAYRQMLDESHMIIRDNIAENSDFAAFMYDVGISVGQMAVALATSKLAGNAFSGISNGDKIAKASMQVIMSNTASVSAIDDAQRRGLSDAQSVIYGVCIGLIEAATEKFSIDAIMKTPTKAFSYVAQNMFTEGSEEFVSEIAGNLADVLINADKSQYLSSVDAYIEQGLSAEDARFRATGDLVMSAFVSGAAGMMTGGILSSGNLALSRASSSIQNFTQQHEADTEIGNALLAGENAEDNIKTLINEAVASENKKLAKAARKVENSKVDFGELGTRYDASARDVGKLTRLSEQQRQSNIAKAAALTDEPKSGFVSRLTSAGMSERDAKKAVKTLIDDAASGKISPQTVRLVGSNSEARPIYEEISKYLSDESMQKRMNEAAEASPVTKITEELTRPDVESAQDLADMLGIADESTIDDPVSILGKNKNGQLIVRTASGAETVYDESAESLSGIARIKMNVAKHYDISGANAYYTLAPDDLRSLKSFNAAFDEQYTRGSRDGEFAFIGNGVSSEIQRAAYNAGKSDLKNAAARSRIYRAPSQNSENKKAVDINRGKVTVSKAAVDVVSKLKDAKLRKQYTASIEVMKALPTIIGANFDIVAAQADSSGRYISPNGVFDPNTNTFTLDILSGMNNIGEVTYSAMVKTAGHELTHYIQRWDAEKYAILKKLTLDFIASERGENWMDAQLEKIIRSNSALGKKLSTEQARDELVADAFEDVLSKIDFAETVHKADKRLFAKIQEWFDKLLEQFKKALRTATEGVTAQSDAARVLNEAGDNAMRLFDSWSDAFASALENSTAHIETQTVDGRGQYEARKKQNDDIFGIDSYTEAQYNKRGWAFVNGILHDRMGQDVFSKIASIRHGNHFEKMPDGTYVIPTGAEESVNNTLVFTDGKHNNPTITQIITIALTEETDISEYRKTLINYLKEGYDYDDIVEVFETVAGKRLFDRYTLQNYESYRELTEQREQHRESNGDSQRGNIGTDGASENTSDGSGELTEPQFSARDVYDVLDIETRANLAEHILTYIEDEGGYRAQLKRSIEKGELNKIKLTAQAYKEAVKVYQDAYRDLHDAIGTDNKDAITLAYSTLALRERALLDIEMSRELRDVIYGLGKNVGRSAKSRRKYTSRDYEHDQKRLANIAFNKKSTEAELRELVAALRRNFTEAERKARESARRAERASNRLEREILRQRRDEYAARIQTIRTKLKTAIEKPTVRASLPKGGEDLANYLFSVTGTLNEMLRMKGTSRSNEELISIIANAARGKDSSFVKSVLGEAEALQKQLSAELSALKREYERIQNVETVDLAWNEELSKRLNEYIDENNDIHGAGDEMLLHIRNGINLMTAMSHRLMGANRAKVAGKWIDILELRNNLKTDIEMSPKTAYKVLNNISYALTPKTMLHLAFGATENSDTLYSMYDDAQNRYMKYVVGAQDHFKALDAETQKSKINSAEANIKTGLVDTDGNEVLLNADLAISFVLACENEDYMRHIIWGGFRLPELKTLYSTKSENAYSSNRYTEHLTAELSIRDFLAEDITDESISAALDRIQRGKELSPDDYIVWQAKCELDTNGTAAHEAEMKAKYKKAAKLVREQLDPLSLNWLNRIRAYYNGYAKTHLDEATMERYGFKKTLSSANSYYPIRVVKSQTNSEQNELIKFNATLESLGSMKNRTKSRLGVDLFGAVSSINSQIEQTATYYGWINAIDTIKKTVGSRIELDNGDVSTLAEVSAKNHGNQKLKNYLDNLERDISGTAKTQTEAERWFNLLHSAFVASSLSFNISPAIKQTSAFPLVAAESGYSNMLKGLYSGGKASKRPWISKAQQEFIARYSLVYKYRAGGLLNIDLATLKNSANPISKLMNKYPYATGVAWCELADAQTLGYQFFALKEQVKKAHPNWNSEDINVEAGKLLDKTIQNYQANYTLLQRAPLLRGKETTRFLFGTFKSQQITMLNTLVDSVLKCRTLSTHINAGYGDTAKLRAELNTARKHAGKVFAATAVSYALNAAFALALSIAYRRKEWTDEELLKDAGWDILESYMSMLPVIGDITYWIAETATGKSTFGASFSEVSAWETFAESITAVADVIERMSEGDLTFDRFMKDFGKLCAPLGIPARNAYNIFKALCGWIGELFGLDMENLFGTEI